MSNSTFNIAPVSGKYHKNELYFHLYMHRKPAGPNHNQSVAVDPKLPNQFGLTVVNDWPLYDGLGTNAKLIARAMGLHMQAGMSSQNWQNYLSIVFEDDRFKGSSLQVMGPVVEEGDWAIVGGTGQFQLAQGIIYKKYGNVIELEIHAFYSVVKPWSLGV